VRVYDPNKITYEQLLDYFWHHIDPTVKNRQFCDVGAQYRTAIFYQDDTQRLAAEASKAALEKPATCLISTPRSSRQVRSMSPRSRTRTTTRRTRFVLAVALKPCAENLPPYPMRSSARFSVVMLMYVFGRRRLGNNQRYPPVSFWSSRSSAMA
jgi:peptide methionine sulfoxide reductase